MVVVDASDTTVHFALVLNYSHEISLYSIVWSRDIVLIRACLSIRSALGQVINLTSSVNRHFCFLSFTRFLRFLLPFSQFPET